MDQYPKRLIEVDLPIKRISAHARRETNIRQGHIKSLHIWWARRPLAACRAVICASLWFDPADEKCPEGFRQAARDRMRSWGKDHRALMSRDSFEAFEKANKDANLYGDDRYLRGLLLDFIADFANWDNSTNASFLETSRALTDAAHTANGGEPGTRPLVVDSFAGGGAIPLEALRVGADPFASDLNPVAVLLNKAVLEYLPKYGQRLAEEVRKWGGWVKEKAERELAEFYPRDADGSNPIAYLWSRTIACGGPGCGVEVPMINQMWIKKKGEQKVALGFSTKGNQIEVKVIHNPSNGEVGAGTSKQASVTCPSCGFTIPAEKVRQQGRDQKFGVRLLCVVLSRPGSSERKFREPDDKDIQALERVASELSDYRAESSLLEVLRTKIPMTELRRISVPLYGVDTFEKIFTQRQRLALAVFEKSIKSAQKENDLDSGLAEAVLVLIALSVSSLLHYNTNLSTYLSNGMISAFIQGTSLAMRSDFAEANPLTGKLVGGFEYSLQQTITTLENTLAACSHPGTVHRKSATSIGLPDDCVDLVVTDPPYYDSIPYSHLSDIFFLWLKSSVPTAQSYLFADALSEKALEIVEDRAHSKSPTKKDADFYEKGLRSAFDQNRQIVKPESPMVVVFAHKSTKGWEAMLGALMDSKWTVTGSWPIDTERPARMNAYQNASLLSSIHVVCRPLEGELVGDWRDVLRELPVRIHEWMPRLASEGIVGADAIFACLGPALEIFSRYSAVEKPSGEVVKLREYLEHVWAAVAKEALTQVFSDADASGLEEDSRLTAMWLWTLNAGANDEEKVTGDESEDDSDSDESSGKKAKASGYVLEYDAARKIAQGLGAHLEDLDSIVEVKGDKARLLPVSERGRDLFGYEESSATEGKKKKKSKVQAKLFTEMEEDEYEAVFGVGGAPKSGETTLDRVHQTMLLFGAGRSEAVKRFLVDDGVGNDERFWRLANALSALYPTGSEEKRWVDGVLARKKGLGF